FAKAANIDFDQLCVVLVRAFPNAFAQLHSRKRATRFPHQDFQERTFALRQLDASLAAPYLALLNVQCHVSSVKNSAGRYGKSATQSIDPREEFVHREWFR